MSRRACQLAAIGLLLALLPGASARPTRPAALSAVERSFLERHWQRPISPQGPPPEHFSALERSLQPADCGVCHPLQWSDWKTGWHARSMGPGITGQLAELMKSDAAGARSCPACHAPLAEQAEEILSGGAVVPNPAYDAALRKQGLVCAGCHVRGHRRFGPPPRGPARSVTGSDGMPHDGFTASSAYLRSEFCASCHQFAPGGFAVNGKLLENTYEEWRRSPAGRQGRQCQDCHMPDRRHLWRGIHDPDMVKSGVRITLTTARTRHRVGDVMRATVVVANTGVGHYFPTYVTPRVLVRAELVDAGGQSVPGTVEERAIGRELPLDLSREIADTRIPPGGRFTMPYSRRIDQSGRRLRVTVTVLPDQFYTGFFEALLANGAGDGEAEIREALEATRRSPFVIWNRDVPLT